MHDHNFKKSVDLLIAKAPNGWTQIEVRYQYYDGAMKINTYYKDSQSGDWLSFNYSEFDLMDTIDEQRELDYQRSENRWTTLTLTISSRSNSTVLYGYDVPNVLGI